jgi:hypothetical protein
MLENNKKFDRLPEAHPEGYFFFFASLAIPAAVTILAFIF